MEITTGYNFEGYEIKEYIDVISEAVVLGTGFASSISASFADFAGSKSGMYADKLQNAKDMALRGLKTRGSRMGANAIIGIDIDYTTFSNDIMGVVANGTAVYIVPKKKDIEMITYSLPSLIYNTDLPFNVCNINFAQNLFSDMTVCSLTTQNYQSENPLAAIIADLEIEKIFGEKIYLSNIIFTYQAQDNKKYQETSATRLNITDLPLNLIGKAIVSVHKYMIGNGHTIEVDNQNNVLCEFSVDDLKAIREINGKDAVCKLSVEDNNWRCYCGEINPTESCQCKRCHRNIDEKKLKMLTSYGDDSITFAKMMKIIESLDSSKEILDYLKGSGNKQFEPLYPDLEKAVLIERMYGKNKQSAINTIKKFMA